MSQRLGLRIDPLDVLFFRDNRPFNVGMRGVGDLPLPQTLAGALRTHVWRQLGLNFDRLSERVRQEPERGERPHYRCRRSLARCGRLGRIHKNTWPMACHCPSG